MAKVLLGTTNLRKLVRINAGQASRAICQHGGTPLKSDYLGWDMKTFCCRVLRGGSASAAAVDLKVEHSPAGYSACKSPHQGK